MIKELRKAIVNRSKLRNKFLKTRNKESKQRFNRQRSFCDTCSAKLKDVFFGKLDHRVVSDNRKFWKTVVLLFSEKAFHKKSVILNNNNKIISKNMELAEIFNKNFSKLVENLEIQETLACNIASSEIANSAFNAIKKYEYHPNVKKSKRSMSGKGHQFSFNFETKNSRELRSMVQITKKLVKKVIYG